MHFTKMQGLGNDYLYTYTMEEPRQPEALARRLSDRHFGPGADGMIWILPSRSADFRMPSSMPMAAKRKCAAMVSAAWANMYTTTV